MILSDNARLMIGLAILSMPTIEFGGYFLLSQLGHSNGIIRTALQGSYFRAGHAHAGVLVILAIIAQLLTDATEFASTLAWLVRIGFFIAPILVSVGFFLGAPIESTAPRRPIIMVYVGALILAASLIVLGLGLLFA